MAKKQSTMKMKQPQGDRQKQVKKIKIAKIIATARQINSVSDEDEELNQVDASQPLIFKPHKSSCKIPGNSSYQQQDINSVANFQ